MFWTDEDVRPAVQVATELFGPVDLKAYEEEGVYRLITKGKLPLAHIVFIDETLSED